MSKKGKVPVFNKSGFKQPVIQEIFTPKEPKLSHDSPDSLPFKCEFKEKYMNFKNPVFGFSKTNKTIKDFITSVFEPLVDTYSGLSWKDVDGRVHCGYLKNISQKQKEILGCFSEEVLSNLYHIDLTYSHRLIGYRKRGVFYPILDDKNHKFTS